MATLINGNGNPRIYAAQDADLIAALAGDITGIAQIGNKFAATAVGRCNSTHWRTRKNICCP